jgi:glycosyltransferase involved in cell wall biosynthesis
MNLLILTQKVDKRDSVLGFFHGWVEEFAKRCEKVTVICLEKGVHDLPNNVRVLGLGKEKKQSRIAYLLHFYAYIWKYRKEYDAVFVHMNPEYVVLGGLFWKLLGKKIGLWYVHRQVNLKLRIAAVLADDIFSVAKTSFRLRTKKVHFLGHGIDTDMFACKKEGKEKDVVSIISVGRITEIKNLDVLITAAALVKKQSDRAFRITLVGEPVTEKDNAYLASLKKHVADLELEDSIVFVGAIPHQELPARYCASDIAVNLAPTGGKDKAVLEALSCGIPTLVSNRAFAKDLGEYAEDLIFAERDPQDLAEKLARLIEKPTKEMKSTLRQRIVEYHNKRNQIEKIVHTLELLKI